MTITVGELYEALKAAGVSDDLARAAAKSVIAIEDKDTLATKADLAVLKSDLLTWGIGLFLTGWAVQTDMVAQPQAFERALAWLQSLDAVDPSVPPRERGPRA